jgi:hypothetical protein
MVGTIVTAVRGADKFRAASLYFASVVVSSAGVGALLGWLGAHFGFLVFYAALLVAGALYLVLFGGYLATGVIPWLGYPRQLPREWIDPNHRTLTVARFGVVFGLGYATPLRSLALLAIGPAAVALANPLIGMLMFAIAGACRALPAIILPIRSTFPDRGPATLGQVMRWRGVVTFADACMATITFCGLALFVAT